MFILSRNFWKQICLSYRELNIKHILFMSVFYMSTLFLSYRLANFGVLSYTAVFLHGNYCMKFFTNLKHMPDENVGSFKTVSWARPLHGTTSFTILIFSPDVLWIHLDQNLSIQKKNCYAIYNTKTFHRSGKNIQYKFIHSIV